MRDALECGYECEFTREAHEKYPDDIGHEFVALAARSEAGAEGLDVERLALALWADESDPHWNPVVANGGHATIDCHWQDHIDDAERIAAKYAALAVRSEADVDALPGQREERYDGALHARSEAGALAVDDEGLRKSAWAAKRLLDIMVERQTLTGASTARDILRAVLAETEPTEPDFPDFVAVNDPATGKLRPHQTGPLVAKFVAETEPKP